MGRSKARIDRAVKELRKQAEREAQLAREAVCHHHRGFTDACWAVYGLRDDDNNLIDEPDPEISIQDFHALVDEVYGVDPLDPDFGKGPLELAESLIIYDRYNRKRPQVDLPIW